MTAVYTVSVVPVSGFTLPVDLTIASYPQTGKNAMPATTSFTFDTSELTYSGSAFGTAQLTISIPIKDFPGATVNYSPIIIQGVGGSYTRQAQISANAKVSVPPVYNEF